MRAKNILTLVPVPTFVKLLYERVTVSRIALFYFSFSLIYCISQLVFQSWAFKINSDAGIFLSRIISVSGDLPVDGPVTTAAAAAVLQDNVTPTNPLSVPISTSTLTSTSTKTSPKTSTSPSSRASASSRPSSPARPTRTAPVDPDETERDEANESRTRPQRFTKRDDGILKVGEGSVFVPNLSLDGRPGVVLNQSCVEALGWPVRTIHNHKREDITFMAFQVWVMGMSVIALLNESIPHISAVAITHILATSWSGFQIYSTREFREEFQQKTNAAGCGVTLLPSYWPQRNPAEIAVLSINSVFLISSLFFTYRLVKTFGWQTFKRIGASLEINRVYKIVLTFSIGLQLAFFCILAAMGLWVDLLMTTEEGQQATHLLMYKVLAILVCILVVPWIYLGWTAVRKESKVLMSVFILISTTMLGGWCAMFVSNTFRKTFMAWSFFAGISTASFFFALMCTILGVICLRNFNKGLKNFLNAAEKLPGDDFTPETLDPEKGPMIQFPPAAAAPAIDVIFNTSPSRYSPEGFSTVSEYDQTTVGSTGSVRRPPPARVPSDDALFDSQGLMRSGSNGSNYSTQSSHRSTESGSGTIRTYAVAGSHHAIMAANQNSGSSRNNSKRGWVIE